MLPNAFIGKPEPPTDDELSAELGRPARTLRLRRGKRAIVYLSPPRCGFTASFALGGKAVEAAR